jgi:hypothetical protein
MASHEDLLNLHAVVSRQATQAITVYETGSLFQITA